VPEEETNNQPPSFWQGDESTGAQISHWERQRWAQFHAAIATSSGDAGVLGNFLPPEVEQEHRQVEEALREEVELLVAMHAKDAERFKAMDAKKDAKLAFETERREEVEEEFQKQEQVIQDLVNNIDWRDWRIPPPSPLR